MGMSRSVLLLKVKCCQKKTNNPVTNHVQVFWHSSNYPGRQHYQD